MPHYFQNIVYPLKMLLVVRFSPIATLYNISNRSSYPQKFVSVFTLKQHIRSGGNAYFLETLRLQITFYRFANSIFNLNGTAYKIGCLVG